jgi:Zn-dependent protease
VDKLTTFLVVLVGWIFSLCLHEFSHALVAYYGGDTTVRDKGYLTFNPLKYTHPVYSILLPMVFLLLGGIGLPGGAVYIERWRLRSRRWESAVSLAGPSANLLLALVLALVFRFAPVKMSGIWPGLGFLALLQIMGALLNLVPVPPLDGYGVIAPYLNPATRMQLDRFGNLILIGFFILLWYVPFVYNVFWTLVTAFAQWIGIPLSLAAQGLTLFQFWRR